MGQSSCPVKGGHGNESGSGIFTLPIACCCSEPDTWVCPTTHLCLMGLNISFVFPLCLPRTSTQLSPASYLRRKSRSCSTHCTQPTGWTPARRDPSLQPAWSCGPSPRVLDSSVLLGAPGQGAQSRSLLLAALCSPLQCSAELGYHIHPPVMPQTLSRMNIQLPILLLCRQTETTSWPDSLLHLPVCLNCK